MTGPIILPNPNTHMHYQHTQSDTMLTPEQHKQIAAAANVIRTGGTVAFPTETVYGLGADVTSPAAIGKIYVIKQRPSNHPLIVHIGQIDELSRWAQAIPQSAWMLAQHFWPGPLTLILKRNVSIPDCVTGGQDTVGIRIPAHPVALALLSTLGADKALAAPSANRFGRISPTTAQHVQRQLGNAVDLILDGGACTVGLESTIVSFHHEAPQILRPGGITTDQIEAVLNTRVTFADSEASAIRTSGTLPAHYAPDTPLKLVPTDQIWQLAMTIAGRNLRVLVMTWSAITSNKPENPLIIHHSMPADPLSYGQLLYAKLHRFDQDQFDYLLVETPPDHTDWLAVTDRLQRASHHFIHLK